MSEAISNMTCDGCGSRPIAAVLAVVQGKVACCPDCNTLDGIERNQLREAISLQLVEVTDEMVEVALSTFRDQPRVTFGSSVDYSTGMRAALVAALNAVKP